VERADLVEALWRHHGVRATVVVTFDYTSLALLELLRRQLDWTASGATGGPVISAAFMVNGGLFADCHAYPWQGTPLLRSPLGALRMRGWQRSPRAFAASMMRARMYSRGYRPAPAELTEVWSAITRRDGAAFAHNAAGFVAEHRRHGQRWDLAAIAVTSAARSPSTSAAARRTPTSTGRSPPPASACPAPRSWPSPVAT
jgi:hypothetical protein